ncbi:DUF2155 domain-containing protein [Novispirillum itersonii]|uniref:DUF2155 domain-containing protein n=1 Tax=Novispirillum itersonii TaxID=189 RepID=A0A7W9ZCH2_NOVIT|nr:DUF2155 domain-containing protein [Novispirillum itersonii]MBB6208708.1 hypothetical protein [Novispirillum itersonii]
MMTRPRRFFRPLLLTGLAACAGMAATLAIHPAMAGEPLSRNTAVLRWLDKGAARVQTLEVPVNQTVTIQTLQVIVRACQQTPPEEPPESAAYVDVWETKAGQPTEDVFRGWLFASSPALSALEHPVYDLWMLDCKDVAGKDATAKDPAAPPVPAVVVPTPVAPAQPAPVKPGTAPTPNG